MIFSIRLSMLVGILFIIKLSCCSGLYCGQLSSEESPGQPCFLEKAREKAHRLRTSGPSLVLPCHVARAKDALVEWWFVDASKQYHIRIHPVFPAVRPVALRFVTSLTSKAKLLNETDVIDASILLRNVNVDDSGLFTCLVRSFSSESFVEIDDLTLNKNYPMLQYQLEFNGPRLCQLSPSTLPCFSSMRSSSPTLVDAFQTTFLQCVVNSFNRPINVFWVIGNHSSNSVLITDYLTTNQYNGDRLRRIFPLSPFDYSIELSVNRSIGQRSYSCVIDGATNSETTLFTYIIRSIEIENEDLSDEEEQPTDSTSNSTTNAETTSETTMARTTLIPHDKLDAEEINSLREKERHSTKLEHSQPEPTTQSLQTSTETVDQEETSTGHRH